MPTLNARSKKRARFKGVKFPISSKMKYRLTLEGELNITPFVARQNANAYLIMRVGNLIMAGEPDLELREDGPYWVVPVVLTSPGFGHVGQVGQILLDAQTGNIIESESTSSAEIENNAERLAQEKAL
jgi:hypothetical protein